MHPISKKSFSYLLSSLSLILGTCLAGASLSACIEADHELNSGENQNYPSSGFDPDENATPDSLAEGWSQLIMIANYAKTTLDSMAHFNTSRNACGKDAYGAIQSSELWNQMVEYINAAIQAQPRSEAYCTPNSQELDANGYYKKSMDGNVEIKLADGSKRQLFETRGSDICTLIQDPALAKGLLSVLNQLVLIADKEDCPHGWGSALGSNHGRS